MKEKYLRHITDYLFFETALETADIIFIPGNGYPNMAEMAAQLMQEDMATYVLPTGKYSVLETGFTGVLDKKEQYRGTYHTEWDFLQQVLVKNGVKKEQILKEDQATYTYENACYCKNVLNEHKIEITKAIICCRNIHARRCLMYYELVFPEVEFMIAPCVVGNITRDNWHETKEGRELVLDEMQRIPKQCKMILEEESTC